MSNENKLQFIEAMLNWFASPSMGRELDVKFLSDAYDDITAPAWVSVEDELPEERKVVWVRKHFKRKYVGEFDFYDSAAFCNGEFQCDASGHVTHWMEIVPPVKKGGEQ